MAVTRAPFQPYKFEEDRDKGKILTLRLNEEEYKELLEDMRALRQAKDSTAIKQLWRIGRNVLHGTETGQVLQLVLRNVELNARTGVSLREPESNANVTQNIENCNTSGYRGVLMPK